MMRLGWTPAADVITMEPKATKAGRVSAGLGVAVAVAAEALRRHGIAGGALLAAPALGWLLERLLLKEAFLLLFPDRVALWLRLRLGGRLLREWESPWQDIEWLRESTSTLHLSRPQPVRQFSIRSSGKTVGLARSAFHCERDWTHFKEVVIERARLGPGEQVHRRKWWGEENYVLYSRQGGEPIAKAASR